MILIQVEGTIKKGVRRFVSGIVARFRRSARIVDDTEPEIEPRQIPDYRRHLLYHDPHCTYCGREVCHGDTSLDRLIPRSRGGSDAKGNLVLACRGCSMKKSNMTPLEWRAELLKKAEHLQLLADKLARISREHRLDRCKVTDREASRQQPQKPAQQPTRDYGWTPEEFEKGRYDYWVMDAAENKPILRNLRLNAAMHVLESVGPEGLQLVMVTQLHHKVLGTAQAGKAVQQ